MSSVTEPLFSKLLNFSQIESPKEMCGLLFHDQFLKCTNTAKNPCEEFKIEPDEYERACVWMWSKPWAIVHSHPGKSARLSSKDCLLMNDLQRAQGDAALAMVIVGFNPAEIRCWRKNGELYHLEWKHALPQV